MNLAGYIAFENVFENDFVLWTFPLCGAVLRKDGEVVRRETGPAQGANQLGGGDHDNQYQGTRPKLCPQ
jgi:hypothetical protein